MKKTSYSAAAISILGAGTALAQGTTSNVVEWHMRCTAPEANETGAGQGSPPPHPSGHPDGTSRKTNERFSSAWEYYTGSTDTQVSFKIDGSLQGRAKDKVGTYYLSDSPLYTAVAYLRSFKRVKDPAGNWGEPEELSWDAGNYEWEETAAGTDPTPRSFPSHSITASVTCDQGTGDISGNTTGDNDAGPIGGMKTIINLVGSNSTDNKTYSITAKAKFESPDLNSGEIVMTTVYNSSTK